MIFAEFRDQKFANEKDLIAPYPVLFVKVLPLTY